jgi:hypothetical protein
LVAAPSEPTTAAQLPTNVRNLLREVEFGKLWFAELTTIPRESLENR